MLMKPKLKEASVVNDGGPSLLDMDILQMAAEEIISAVEAKNAAALKEALKSFIEMCDSEEE